jgi:CBS domain-containing protein
MNATDEPCAGEVMAHSFLSIAPEDTLGEVAERMAEADAGSALVAEYGRLTGILTSRDVPPRHRRPRASERGTRARVDDGGARDGTP